MKHALRVSVWMSAGVLRLGMQEERRSRTREAPKAPVRGETMKPTALGHERVKSPDTAWARVESWNRERTGRRETAACRRGVLSGIVVGGRESRPHGEGPDGSTQLAKETRAGHAGSGKHEPTSLRGLSNWTVKRATVTVRANASATEEPDAGKPHVRVCGGGSG
jgi:hypothetical protein